MIGEVFLKMGNYIFSHKITKKFSSSSVFLILIFVAAIPRIFGLAVFLTADEPKSWFGRSIQFLQAIAEKNWLGTWDSPAPGVTTMWAGSIGLLLDYFRHPLNITLVEYLHTVPFDPLSPAILPWIRLTSVLVAVLAVVLTYWWGKNLWGEAAAFLAAIFLALNPFLLALSRILGHDALVAIFMWLSLLAFLRVRVGNWSKQNVRFIVQSAVFGGLAFLTKYPSLSLGAFIAVVMLVDALRSETSKCSAMKNWGITILLWSFVAGAVFVIAFPAMWVDPIGRAQAIIADAFRASGSPHPKGSFFMGQPVPDPGGIFYLLVTLFKTTPIIWWGWILAIATSSSARFRKQWGRTALIFVIFVLFYGALVTIGGKKQDRYILPVFPALMALSALGYAYFLQQAKRSIVQVAAIVLLAGIQIVGVLPYYPYYFTYYNPLMGGGNAAEKQIIVGWGEGLDAAARWLNTLPNAEDLDVVAWYSTTFEPYFRGHAIYKIDDAKISRTPKPGLAADYVVFYINQIQRELPSPGALQFFQASSPVHTVFLNGTPYAWIYPSVKMQHVIEPETRLVGQAALMGYNLIDGYGASTSELTPDKTTTLQLYWEWQGKKPDEPLRLEIVDGNGRVWGDGENLGTEAPIPFEQWQDGMVGRDDFAISLLPGTPPGNYHLRIWIDRPATGEVVGVFPLDDVSSRITVARPSMPPAEDALSLDPVLNVSQQPGIVLLGGNFHPAENGHEPELELFWQATQSISQSFAVTINMVDQQGTEWTNWTGNPVNGSFPTDKWFTGDIIRDPWTLLVPPYIPPGKYRLQVALGDSDAVTVASLSIDGRPRLFSPIVPDIPLDVQFDGGVKLVGLTGTAVNGELQISPGQLLEMAQIWQTDQPLDANFTITTQLLNGENSVIAQNDAVPQNGGAPTVTWTPGEFIENTVALAVPNELGKAPYRLLIALYLPETGERLLVRDGSDHIEIPVVVK